MHRALVTTLAALLLGGCNSYDYFRVTGYLQESFSNQADILFVLDNSASMTDEGPALVQNIESFITEFASDNASVPDNPTLSDDVGRFIEYVGDRTGNINYSLAVTNTEPSDNAGALLGTPPIVRKTDDNVVRKFSRNVICDAACIPGRSLPPEVDVTCPIPPTNGVNCANNSAGSAEEGLEAVLMAMCRAVEDPPEFCFQEWWQNPDTTARRQWLPFDPARGDTDDTDGGGGGSSAPTPYFREAEVGTNAGWIRPNSAVIPVIITDEGDQSRRITTFDGDIFPYDDLFRAFPNRMTWAVIGPVADGGCNQAGAARWGIDRYRRIVNATNGTYIPIAVSDGRGGCDDADFGAALSQIGDLLRALVDSFPLRALPVPGTIVVVVDGQVVDASEETFDTDLGAIVFSDGWSYDPTSNSVVLHGDAVPDFNADVRVYYKPGEGVPRELPF